MNELEHQLIDKALDAIHSVEKEVIELRGEVKSLREHFDDQYKSLSEKLDRSIETDTKRLDAHSQLLDEHSEKLATFDEWKKSFEESVRNRLALFQSVSAVGCVIIAYLLSKFF